LRHAGIVDGFASVGGECSRHSDALPHPWCVRRRTDTCFAEHQISLAMQTARSVDKYQAFSSGIACANWRAMSDGEHSRQGTSDTLQAT
jgi:hypothetical protein